MKKTFYLLVFIVSIIINGNITFAQVPQGIPYQAVARNSDGNIMSLQNISVRFSIRDAAATGSIVYQETHSTTTSAQGLFSLNIGMGTASIGTFSNINWGVNTKFMQVELDASGGSNFVEMGTQQMMSVPYALKAKSADTITGSINENDPHWTASPSFGISNTNINNWNTAFGWGNHTGLYRPIGWVPSWTDITDKPSFSTVATSGNYNDLSNTPVIPAQTSQLTNNSGFITNEAQILSISHDTIFLTGSSFVKLPSSSSSQGVRLGFSSSTTWTCPAGVTQITVELWGGAGGGGGSSMVGSGEYVGYYGNIYHYAFGCYNSSNSSFTSGSGGQGGKGGYNNSIITVIPGQIYSINIGDGGTGGTGGSYIVTGYGNTASETTTQALSGANGNLTNFNSILVADGGNGGDPGLATRGSTTSSCTNGLNGNNANVFNLNSSFIPNSTQPRTYIPNAYYSQNVMPNFAVGGNGGSSSTVSSGGGCANGHNGSNGENGFCIISY